MKNTTSKVAKTSKSLETPFQYSDDVQKELENNTRRINLRTIQWVLIYLFIVCFNTVQGQNSVIAPIDFNIERDKPLQNPNGLTVGMTLGSWKQETTNLATLDGAPERKLEKGVFELIITIQNNGSNDIAIYDWSFSAICPKNVHGQEWQADSKAPKLTTAIIPSNIFIVLKPGEKKTLLSAPSDFYWCLSPDPGTLLEKPKFLTARVVCAVLNPTKNLSNFNPNMQKLIQDYWNLLNEGKTTEATAKRQQILNLGASEYPTKKAELIALMGETTTTTYAKKKAGNIQDQTADVNKMQVATAKNNSVYSDWLTIKNPYYAMQIRYKLEKQEGDIGYFRTQMRIDFEDKDRCKDTRCLGYVVSFGYPTLEGTNNIYLNYKFYYSYKEIHTVPDLIPIKLSLPDGSKRLLKQDGFYYTAANNPQEMDLRYYFDKAVDLILEGSPIKVSNFNESKAVILK